MLKTSDEENTKLCRTEINNYAQNKDIKIEQIYEYSINARQSKTNLSINKIIEKLQGSDTLIIENLNILGNTIFKVIQKITRLTEKNVRLHLIYENIILRQNDERLGFLYNLLSLENNFIKKRTQSADDTRKTKKTQLGRKSGKKTKSIYDKYKKRIMHLEKLGVSKKKIIDEIKIGSSQGLGVYIKKVKESLEKSRTSNKTVKKNETSNSIKVEIGNAPLDLKIPIVSVDQKKSRNIHRKNSSKGTKKKK
jgi:DNA invertase Pin-like site-specific DNA recombinase